MTYTRPSQKLLNTESALLIFVYYCSSSFIAGYCQNLDELIPTANHDSPTVVPKFISRGHLYKAIVGDTIELPCKVQNLGKCAMR